MGWTVLRHMTYSETKTQNKLIYFHFFLLGNTIMCLSGGFQCLLLSWEHGGFMIHQQGDRGWELVMSDSLAYFWLYLMLAQRRTTTAATHWPETFYSSDHTSVSSIHITSVTLCALLSATLRLKLLYKCEKYNNQGFNMECCAKYMTKHKRWDEMSV